MDSIVIWVTLATCFVGGVYLAGHILKPKKDLHAGITFTQKHPASLALLTIVVPISIGVLMVNTVFSTRPVIKNKKIEATSTTNVTASVVHVDLPEPLLKMVISDGSKEIDIATLNFCKADKVTVIEKQLILCKSTDSVEVRAWLLDAKLQEKRLLNNYIAHQRAQHKQIVLSPPNAPSIEIQGVTWLNYVPKVTSTQKVIQEKKPLKDRYAELFFFLALVAGVLSKYFWDFYEERRQGIEITFEPHVIVMSFIISALVYYSIQQGLENEAGKLTTRGILFAFNNGFMWQTILKSTRLSSGSTAKVDEQVP